jgi:hypothetical protein
MAKGISINFLADVRDFLRGTKNVEEELDDVADSLDNLAKDGENAVEDVEKSFRELAKEAKASGKAAGDGLGDGVKKGAKDAEDATEVLKKEAIANLSEVTSSFDGSVESLADGIQGTLGGIVQDLGPLGIAAGAAGAAGVGLIIKAFTDAEEEAQKTRDRVQALAETLIDVGDAGVPIEYVAEQLKLIAVGADESRKKFKDIKKEAKDLGLEVGGLAYAYAGGTDELENQLEVLDDLLEAERDQQQAVREGTAEFNQNTSKKILDIIGQQVELKKVKEEIELAQEAEQAFLASGGAEAYAKAEAISQIDAAYDEAVYSVGDFLNAETGIYDLEAYAQSIRDREALLLDYQNALAESGLSTDQKAALNELGVEQANAILKGLKDPNVSENTKTTIKNGLRTASKEGSGVAQEELKKAFQKPIEAKVNVNADTVGAQRDLDNLIKARTAIIKVDFQDRYGKRAY